MLLKMLVLGELAKMLLEVVATGLCQIDDIHHRDSAVLSDGLHDLKRQIEQCGQHDLFTLYLFSKRQTCTTRERKKNASHGCQLGAFVRMVPVSGAVPG